jgi:hypothetical protein
MSDGRNRNIWYFKDMKLLVFETDPARPLARILAEHVPGWEIVSPGRPDEPGNAALIAEADKAGEIAASLREAGMIGPIFALVEDQNAVSPPVVPLAKPLRLATFLAKLEAPGDAAVDGAIIGNYRFDAGARSLVHIHRGDSERLTDKEAQVLGLLLRSRDGLSREDLQAAAFGYAAETDTHTVETHIWRLRQKLETDPAAPQLLLTEGNIYRLRSISSLPVGGG